MVKVIECAPLLALDTWLRKVDARLAWSQSITGSRWGYIAGYNVNGHIVLVQVLTAPGQAYEGFELYVPASNRNDTTDTFAAAERACGLAPSAEFAPATA